MWHPRQPCTFFMQGNCRYGDACAYSHDIPPQRFQHNAPQQWYGMHHDPNQPHFHPQRPFKNMTLVNHQMPPQMPPQHTIATASELEQSLTAGAQHSQANNSTEAQVDVMAMLMNAGERSKQNAASPISPSAEQTPLRTQTATSKSTAPPAKESNTTTATASKKANAQPATKKEANATTSAKAKEAAPQTPKSLKTTAKSQTPASPKSQTKSKGQTTAARATSPAASPIAKSAKAQTAAKRAASPAPSSPTAKNAKSQGAKKENVPKATTSNTVLSQTKKTSLAKATNNRQENKQVAVASRNRPNLAQLDVTTLSKILNMVWVEAKQRLKLRFVCKAFDQALHESAAWEHVLLISSNLSKWIGKWIKPESLRMLDCYTGDLSALSQCTNLETLAVRTLYNMGHFLNDISPLANCVNLKKLDLSQSNVSDITPLASCTELQSVDLEGTTFVRDISVFASPGAFPNLKHLNVVLTSVTPAQVEAVRAANPQLRVQFEIANDEVIEEGGMDEYDEEYYQHYDESTPDFDQYGHPPYDGYDEGYDDSYYGYGEEPPSMPPYGDPMMYEQMMYEPYYHGNGDHNNEYEQYGYGPTNHGYPNNGGGYTQPRSRHH